jgi:hypothetical protein
MKSLFYQLVLPSDFRQFLRYFFTDNYQIGDALYLKRKWINIKSNDDISNENISNLDCQLSFDVVSRKKVGQKFHARIKLNNMIGSTINGVPFYQYKLIQEATAINEYELFLKTKSPFHDTPDCYVLGVTPVPNMINGADKIYPFWMYNGFDKFREVTEEFQKITFPDLFKLYNSGFNNRFKENHYFKSIDFSKNAPFSFNFSKKWEEEINRKKLLASQFSGGGPISDGFLSIFK